MMRDLPNILTVTRVAIIPVLLFVMWLDTPMTYWISAGLFGFASLTDYFDGVLARHYQAHSSFGRVLDPIADKLLVASTLMMLVYFDRAPIIPALLILCREITVSGLREYLSEFKVSMPVTNLAKVKTAIQFVAILVLILGTEATQLTLVRVIGDVLLWVAAMLTIFTGYSYLKEGFSRL
jgi:cardiolipin synthase (CMP-forming)